MPLRFTSPLLTVVAMLTSAGGTPDKSRCVLSWTGRLGRCLCGVYTRYILLHLSGVGAGRLTLSCAAMELVVLLCRLCVQDYCRPCRCCQLSWHVSKMHEAEIAGCDGIRARHLPHPAPVPNATIDMMRHKMIHRGQARAARG